MTRLIATQIYKPKGGLIGNLLLAQTAQTLSILINTRNILSTEAAWCQGTTAMTAEGNLCPTNSDRAAQWCVTGAIFKAASSIIPKEPGSDAKVRESCYDVAKELGFPLSPQPPSEHNYLTTFNDTHYFSEVTELLDNTIDRLKTERDQ